MLDVALLTNGASRNLCKIYKKTEKNAVFFGFLLIFMENMVCCKYHYCVVVYPILVHMNKQPPTNRKGGMVDE